MPDNAIDATAGELVDGRSLEIGRGSIAASGWAGGRANFQEAIFTQKPLAIGACERGDPINKGNRFIAFGIDHVNIDGIILVLQNTGECPQTGVSRITVFSRKRRATRCQHDKPWPARRTICLPRHPLGKSLEARQPCNLKCRNGLLDAAIGKINHANG
ncbi:hypothetical protein D3C73_565830 [compost metagenome]